MKIKPKKKSKRATLKTRSLGSLEELKAPNYLPDLRSKHREGGTLDLYCELLETQIGSLVDKILSFDMNDTAPEGDTEKALRIARERINAASNELSQAQQYLRDNHDN